MKVKIIYWSGTGNTEAMAQAVYDGAISGGAEADLIPVSIADKSVLDADVIIFGCPAMGAEQLEEGEFEPFFEGIEGELSGKKIGLFGSYDWGDGEWMRTWQARAEEDGAVMIQDGVIANNAPDEMALIECKALGEAAAKA